MHLDATEHGNELIFLHTVKDGPANQSYGLHVARLAGVPQQTVDAARAYLGQLERELDTLRDAGPQAELPLAAPPADDAADELRERLEALDVDALSPRDALAVLYELVAAARTKS